MILVDSGVATMEDKDSGSGASGWTIGVLATIAIGGLLTLYLSPSLDTILRGCFLLTLCGFLETYLSKRH